MVKHTKKYIAVLMAILLMSLILSNMMYADVLDAFAQENPGIELRVEKSREIDSILTDLMTQDSTVDVYVLSSAMSPAFKTIRNQGYAMPIENEAIRAYVEQLYPQIQREVMADGDIYGVPIGMQVQMSAIGVNLELWERLALSKDELPQSWGR